MNVFVKMLLKMADIAGMIVVIADAKGVPVTTNDKACQYFTSNTGSIEAILMDSGFTFIDHDLWKRDDVTLKSYVFDLEGQELWLFKIEATAT